MSSPRKKKIPTRKVSTKAKTAPRTERTGRASERMALATLDALSAHIAILDRSGTIIAVNRAWRNFAKANQQSLACVCEGVNYLSVCDAASGPDAATAAKVARVVRAVIRGQRQEFLLEYPCHSPKEQRWFDVRITRFPGRGPARAVVAHENITERKRAESARRESEERLRLAAEAGGFGTYSYDCVTGASHWSPELKVLLGVAPDQPLPLDKDKLFTGLHPEDRSAFLAAMTAANNPRGNGVFRLEYRVIHPGGKVRWLHVRGLTKFAGKGAARHATHAAGVVLDITERKLVEAEFQLAQQRQALHVEQTPLAVIEFDLTGRVQQWNPAAVALFGFSRDEAVGKHWTFIAPTALHEQLEGTWAALVGQRGGQRSTNDNLTRDGRTISCEWFNTPLIDSGGRTIGVASLILDVTDRKQSEAALREAHQLTRQIFGGARAGIVVYGTDMRYQVWNPYMEELTGVPAAAVLGRLPVDVFPFLRETGVIQMIESALAGESPAPSDFAFKIHSSGRSGWVSDWTAPLRNSSGAIIGAVGMVRDITDRKRREVELQNSREHLRALAARLQSVREEERTRIAREIHDELGQQLTGLKMDLRWLEHGLEDLRDSRANALIDKTMEATGLLDATVKTVQRIAADLRPAVLDKLGLVAALRREARQVQQHLGIACTLTGLGIEPQLPALVAITCFRIFQEAITNVARHAAATAIEVELKTQPDGLVLEVRDNGKGIPPAIAVSAETLGLIGMRERARAVGGTVTFAPRAEGGTVVRLEIPLAAKE